MHQENPLFKQLDSEEFVRSRQAQLQAKLKRNGHESLTQAQQEVEQALEDQAGSSITLEVSADQLLGEFQQGFQKGDAQGKEQAKSHEDGIKRSEQEQEERAAQQHIEH